MGRLRTHRRVLIDSMTTPMDLHKQAFQKMQILRAMGAKSNKNR